ncbi:MAG TPA: hypothetical protein VLZ07_03930 [Syntrophales bacterium]|nr:hypothetical protein [Syntrophales bacterium]
MEKLIFSIAGVSIAVSVESHLHALLKPLTPLLDGFLIHTGAPDVILNLSYDPQQTYPCFEATPVNLSAKGIPGSSRLVDALGNTYRLSENAIMIGFLNGCLFYNPSSNDGHLLLLRSHDRNHIVATIHKMLFAFTSLVLAERNRFMAHGAGICGKDGENGLLFLGDSGAGKTSVAGLAPMDAVLSDDAPVIGKEAEMFCIYSSPFSQINMFEKRTDDYFRKKVRLRKVLFLNKADELRVTARERRSALLEMVNSHVHSLSSMDRRMRLEAFNFCYDLFCSVSAYDLYFQKNDKFWDVLN